MKIKRIISSDLKKNKFQVNQAIHSLIFNSMRLCTVRNLHLFSKVAYFIRIFSVNPVLVS